jgi:hypothetical protein
MGLQLSGSIQLEGNLLVTGSANSVFENILVSGKLTAQEIETQFVSASIIYSSGSNKFGDEITDNQQFTGSVDISGSLGVNGIPTFGSVSGSVNTIPKFTGGYLLGDSGIFESGGNVGIGTINPVSVAGQTSLTVNGTNVGRYDIYVNGTHNAQFLSTVSELQIGSLVNIPFSFYTSGSERMRITSVGNVGIGTTSPTSKLHVANAAVGTAAIFTNTNDSDLFINFNTSITTLMNTVNASLAFGTNNTERIRITSGGDVGIGTASPKLNSNAGTFLTVQGTSATGWLELSTDSTSDGIGGAISFNNTNIVGSDKRNAQIAGFREGANNSGVLAFATWNAGVAAERMRITSGGNVGIGTDNPTSKLDVNGAITINGTITNNGTGTGIYTKTVWAADTTNQISFENGRVSDSDDSTGRTVYFTWRGGPTFGGGVQLQHGANAWAAYTSDARLKTVVANIDSGLAAIMKLNPIKYKWTKEIETSRTVLGFTAQNVGEAIPEAMFKSWQDDELGDVLSYYQEYLTPYLVKAIQEQQQQIENLTSRLEALETK